MKTIEVTVSPTGETQVETKGFAGSDCHAASRFVEEALGIQTREVFTAEYHLAATQSPGISQHSEPSP